MPSLLAASLMLLAPAHAAPVRFACAVEGAKLIVPSTTPETVCGIFATAVEKALGAPVRRVAVLPDSAEDKSGWVRVEVRFARPGIASARLVCADKGRVVAHPEQSIAVSDRAIGRETVERLAREVAGRILSK